MKKGIHPELKDATVICGTQGKAKKTGSVEKFNRKYGLDQENKAA